MRTTTEELERLGRIRDSQQPGFDLHKYLKCNRHHEGKPSWLTYRQLDILIRYAPGPLGLGMDVKEIGKDLKLNRRTVQRVLKQLNTKFPKAMSKLKSMRSAMMRQSFGSSHKRSLDGMLAAVDEGGLYEEVKRTF